MKLLCVYAALKLQQDGRAWLGLGTGVGDEGGEEGVGEEAERRV
jgi:hypothetical protein